jgi:hypothetical protein
MKKLCARFQWYSIVITAGICMFSLLCWINFARNMVSLLVSHIETSTDAEKVESKNNDVELSNVVEVAEVQNEENKIVDYIDMLDGYINKADSMWYNTMFKKAN